MPFNRREARQLRRHQRHAGVVLCGLLLLGLCGLLRASVAQADGGGPSTRPADSTGTNAPVPVGQAATAAATEQQFTATYGVPATVQAGIAASPIGGGLAGAVGGLGLVLAAAAGHKRRSPAMPGMPGAPTPPPPNPNTAAARDDAMLAYHLGEQGRVQTERARLLDDARRHQAEQDAAAPKARDRTQELAAATAATTYAQAELNQFISHVLTSPLAPTDVALARYDVWLRLQQAHAWRAQVLAEMVHATTTELDKLTLRRQQAVQDGTPAAARAALDMQIAALQAALNGDPAIAAQIATLTQQRARLAAHPPHGPARPWRQRVQALESQIAALQEQGRGLRAQAQAEREVLEAAGPHTEHAATTVQTTLHDYHADLVARLPAQQAALQRLRADAANDPGTAPLTSALDAVAQALLAHDPETLQAALAELDAASTPGMYGNAWVAQQLRRDVLSGDPRLVVLEQRDRAAVATNHPAAAAMWLDLLTVGSGPVLADRAQLAEPGGSAALTQQLHTTQLWDSAFLLLNLLGPLAEARTLLVGGRRLPTALVAQLRDAGYTEAAIAALSTRLAPALADSAELRRLVYAGEPEAVQAFVESLRTLDNAPQQVFSHVLPTRRQQAVNRYVYQTEVVSADGTTYTYGNSVRNFDLRGKPYVQLDPELRALGFEQHIGVINGRDGAPVLDANGQTVRQVYYTHPDGGMVRIKPDGDPLSPKRKQPHVSKSVRYPHNGPFDDFFYEGFKVDAYGKPLPRAPDDTFISFPPRTAEEGVALDDLMNQVHVYLPWGDQ